MQQRVMGCETELALALYDEFNDVWTYQGADRAAAIALSQYMPTERHPRHKLTNTNHYYENGMRIYLDMGSHPEICTAESTDSQDVVAGHLAGLLLVHRAFKKAHESERFGQYTLAQRVVSEDTSWGFHENYLVDRAVAPGNARGPLSSYYLSPLRPFLAVRSQITGAGSMRRGAFYLSQKSTRLNADVSLSTTVEKPLINTRDEPHADPQKYARLHIPCGDPNSPAIMKYSLDMTSLVLRMIEQHKRPNMSYDREHWATFARRVSGDVTMQSGVPGLTGLDIHEKYLHVLQPMVEYGVPPAEAAAFTWWTSRYEELRELQTMCKEYSGESEEEIREAAVAHIIGSWAGSGTCDYADRLAYIQEGDPSEAAGRDFDYDLVSKNGKPGKFWTRIKTPASEAAAPRELMRERLTTAPSGRAKVRAQFIRDFGAETGKVSVDWSLMSYDTGDAGGSVKLELLEPAVEDTATYQDFIERVAAAKAEAHARVAAAQNDLLSMHASDGETMSDVL